MKTLTIPYSPHLAQKMFHDSTARFRTLNSGRRFGKSQAAVNEAIKIAVALPPGSIEWVVAPVFAQAMINWRKFKFFLPKEIIKSVNKSEKYIELVNESTIWIKSGDNPDTLRGEGIDLVIVDEAAMVKKDVWEEALRPALADKQGKGIFISTPKGHNWFFDMWTRGQDPEFPDYESWSFPTAANPYIDPKEIDEARRTLPEMIYRQEFLAEFLDEIGAVFRGVEGCIKGELSPDPVQGDEYVMGVDVAKYVDFTVLCVLNQRGELVDFERFNQIDWSFQKQRIIAKAEKYNARVILDSTGVGDPIFEDMRNYGLNVEGYKFTNESKKKLVEGLSIAIEQNQIAYPDIPVLINELRIFGFEISATGAIKYNAPAGYHDDCVISLALATYGSVLRNADYKIIGGLGKHDL